MSELSERFYMLEYKQKMEEYRKREKEKEKEKIQKELKKAQRKKEQEKERKQYEKDLLLSCKMDLKNKFEEEFDLQGLKAKYYFYNLENRNIIINSIGKSNLEYDYLESNYNKILQETIKKYELNEQYNEQRNKEIAQEYAEKMRPTWEKEAKKEKTKNATFNILNAIFGHPIIVFFIIVVIFFTAMFIDALGFSFFPALGMSLITIFVLLLGFLGKL